MAAGRLGIGGKGGGRPDTLLVGMRLVDIPVGALAHAPHNSSHSGKEADCVDADARKPSQKLASQSRRKFKPTEHRENVAARALGEPLS